MPKDADLKARMAGKLRSNKGSRIYAQRRAIVEPVIGQIKEATGPATVPSERPGEGQCRMAPDH